MNEAEEETTYDVYVDSCHATEQLTMTGAGKFAFLLYANTELDKTLKQWGESNRLYEDDTGVFWTTTDSQKATYVKLRFG